jgi:hypothetical protein
VEPAFVAFFRLPKTDRPNTCREESVFLDAREIKQATQRPQRPLSRGVPNLRDEQMISPLIPAGPWIATVRGYGNTGRSLMVNR